MASFADLDLVLYNISPLTGFLPETAPLHRLQDPYSAWEDIVGDMVQLVEDDALRSKLECLPCLSTSSLHSEAEWRRAYVVLSFLSQGYIWSGKEPKATIPISIASPLKAVSEYLQIKPYATFAAFCLWNNSLKPDLTYGVAHCNPDDYACISSFTGLRDEEWFFVISAAIEAQGACLIPKMLDAFDAVHSFDTKRVQQFLDTLNSCVGQISTTLDRMYEHCTPDVFYNRLRPFLKGSKNMAKAGLPDGVFYPQGEDGAGEWHVYSGASNAQSSMIQLLDIMLGIDHSLSSAKGMGFLKEMREYMPGPHRQFLELMADISNIRGYVMSQGEKSDLGNTYNQAVLRLGALRDRHIRMVSRYIINPATKDETNRGTMCEEKRRGTGGTDLMQFLRKTRDTTKSATCCDDEFHRAKPTSP